MALTEKQSVLKTPTAKATTTLEEQSPVLPLPDTPQGVMAVGPRVTFKFDQDYDQANSYDYYDVVNVDGTSYIAIQDVPANTPISNTDYWVKWNDPNAQMAQLQDTVETFDGRITQNANGLASETAAREEADSNLQNQINDMVTQRKMVVIGDSYSAQSYLPGGTLWCSVVADDLGLELHNYGDPGAGFLAQGDEANSTFASQLQKASADLGSAKDLVDYVFVYGGTNDVQYPPASASSQTLINAFETFASNARATFPKASIIYLGSTAFQSFNYKAMGSVGITELWVSENFKNDKVVSDSRIACFDLTFLPIGMPDYFTGGYASHPNQDFHKKVASCVIKALNGAQVLFVNSVYQEASSSSSGVTIGDNLPGYNRIGFVASNISYRLYCLCNLAVTSKSYWTLNYPFGYRPPTSAYPYINDQFFNNAIFYNGGHAAGNIVGVLPYYMSNDSNGVTVYFNKISETIDSADVYFEMEYPL